MLLTQRRLFVLLGILAAGVIIGLRVQTLIVEQAQVLSQRQAQAATLAQFAATYSARLYDQSGRVAQEVARHVRDENPSDAALHAYLAARANDTSADDYIVVLDPSGRVRATSESQRPSTMRFGASNPASSWRAGDQKIVPVLRSQLTGSVIYSLSQRLDDRSGRFLGVVGVNVRPEGVRDTVQRKADDPLLSVWGQDGRFIAANFVDFDANGRAIAPPKPPGLGIPGSAKDAEQDALTASAPVQGWPLVAVASYDRAGVLQGWRRRIHETIVLVLLAMLGIGALVWFGVKAADREAVARKALQEANVLAAEALKDRDLLMREVDHRVKNSLMMTASLLHLQERRFSDPEVREAFESARLRLNSIGLVHEALYSGSSLEEVDLADYLKRLLDELASACGAEARGVTVALECAPLLLAAHQTTPVGLIVAEVVTNAFKHAFGERDSGTILARVRLTNLNDIEIEIKDDGSGYATARSPEAPSGLGARLIQALTQQLGGTLSLANEGGAAFRLTFPRLARAEGASTPE